MRDLLQRGTVLGGALKEDSLPVGLRSTEMCGTFCSRQSLWGWLICHLLDPRAALGGQVGPDAPGDAEVHPADGIKSTGAGFSGLQLAGKITHNIGSSSTIEK